MPVTSTSSTSAGPAAPSASDAPKEPSAPHSAGAIPTPVASPSQVPAALGASDCIVVNEENLTGSDVTLEGRVASGEHSHPNGSMFTFYTLQLPAPRCVRGASDTTSIDELQLAPASDAIPLKRFVGKRVRIKGSAFPWNTAWHARPVLVSFDAIEPIP